MCILDLLRLHVSPAHRSYKKRRNHKSRSTSDTQFSSVKNWSFQVPPRCNGQYPEFLLCSIPEEPWEYLSLQESTCSSDFIYNGRNCMFHGKQNELSAGNEEE